MSRVRVTTFRASRHRYVAVVEDAEGRAVNPARASRFRWLAVRRAARAARG